MDYEEVTILDEPEKVEEEDTDDIDDDIFADDDDEIDDTIFDEEEVFVGFDDEYGDAEDFDFDEE